MHTAHTEYDRYGKWVALERGGGCIETLKRKVRVMACDWLPTWCPAAAPPIPRLAGRGWWQAEREVSSQALFKPRKNREFVCVSEGLRKKGPEMEGLGKGPVRLPLQLLWEGGKLVPFVSNRLIRHDAKQRRSAKCSYLAEDCMPRIPSYQCIVRYVLLALYRSVRPGCMCVLRAAILRACNSKPRLDFVILPLRSRDSPLSSQ